MFQLMPVIKFVPRLGVRMYNASLIPITRSHAVREGEHLLWGTRLSAHAQWTIPVLLGCPSYNCHHMHAQLETLLAGPPGIIRTCPLEHPEAQWIGWDRGSV